MTNEVSYSREQITSFVDLLKNELPEHRDNRGKRHPLALVIAAFVLATLVGRQKLSSIHRFMRNRVDLVARTDPNSQSKTYLPCASAAFVRWSELVSAE